MKPAIEEEIDRLKNELISESEFEKSQNQMENQWKRYFLKFLVNLKRI